MRTNVVILSVIAMLGGMAVTATGQVINGFTSQWVKILYNHWGGFGRAVIDGHNLVISGADWQGPATDQLITKVNSNGDIIFQIRRSPGGDHDAFVSVVKLANGNYGFFGQQNAQGTQYFDGFYAAFNNSGTEVDNGFFGVAGSTNGTDMQLLPNGNLAFTGNQGAKQNFIAVTDQDFNTIAYKTFQVNNNNGWNTGQIGVDATNNVVYAIGSEVATQVITIAKYDLALNYISTAYISNSGPIFTYDVAMDGSDLLLCGYKVIGGLRRSAFYRMNANGIVTDSLVGQSNTEFTAVVKFGNRVLLARSTLSGGVSSLNEIVVYNGSGSLGITHPLNNSATLAPYDLVLDADTLYAVGVSGAGVAYWIGNPTVEKLTIGTCGELVTTQPTDKNVNLNATAQFTIVATNPLATLQWQTNDGNGFQNVTNAGQYSGAATAQLTVSNVVTNNNNQTFRCIVIDGACTDTSDVATLTIQNNGGGGNSTSQYVRNCARIATANMRACSTAAAPVQAPSCQENIVAEYATCVAQAPIVNQGSDESGANAKGSNTTITSSTKAVNVPKSASKR